MRVVYTLLVCGLAVAIATPPLSTIVEDIITTGNSSSLDSPLRNMQSINLTGRTNDFPPGPQPPHETFVYNISYTTDPPTYLKFYQYRPNSGPSESHLEAAFKEAINQALSTSHKRDALLSPNVLYEWGTPEASIWVTPSSLHEASGIGLTWGILLNALVGMNRFRLAYPGLGFSCIVKIRLIERSYSVAVIRINSRHVFVQ